MEPQLRFVLNMKKLAYKTVWVEYPDIAALYATFKMPSVEVRDAKPLYGLPVIYDPSTEVVLCESQHIAHYLEATYPTPDTMTLFPSGSEGLQRMFVDIFIQKISDPLHLITSVYAMGQLPPRSSEFYSRRRAARYGKPLDEVAPPGSTARAEVWACVRAGFREFDKWAGAAKFTTGDRLVFSDVVVASYLTWFKRLLGTDSVEWQDLTSDACDGGRWKFIANAFQKWEYVDQDGLENRVFWNCACEPEAVEAVVTTVH